MSFIHGFEVNTGHFWQRIGVFDSLFFTVYY
jgi:hypothetical protein